LSVAGVTLKAVRRCVRCEIPGIDQSTGARSHQPMATLAGYRADPTEDGGVTFGVYCIIHRGAGGTLRVDDPVTIDWRD
jgi:hypothetical protein